MPEAEIVAQAIYDAVDTISGDTVATVISMSSHLFETIDDGETEVEAVLRATMSVCRDAARAAIAALDNVRGDGWRTMDDAPMDGQAFLAVVHGQVRVVAYGKTSHVPIMGFCLADQGAEEFDLCEPSHWRPLPAPPTTEGA